MPAQSLTDAARSVVEAFNSADWERLPDRFGFDPARESEWRDLAAAV